MKKFILFLFLIPLFLKGQVNNAPGYFECSYHFDEDYGNADKTIDYAPYGGQFTPKGHFHGLIIFVNFMGNYQQYSDNPGYQSQMLALNSYNVAGWNHVQNDWNLNYMTSVQSNGTALNLFYSTISEFTQYATDPSVKNLSKFYSEMSKGSFQFTCDVYKRDGQPYAISVDPTGATSWGNLNSRAIQKIKDDDPSFDWSVYDNRQNGPCFDFDNSDNNTYPPDNKPDFIVFVYKYNSTIGQYLWNPSQNIYITGSNINAWAGSGGGYAVADMNPSINFNGYTFDGSGFTFCLGDAGFHGLFLHEVAHGIFNDPHYGGANQVSGPYFYPENGWGMMNIGSGAFYSALGWERWYLDWIQLKSNNQTLNSDIKTISDLPSNGEFILNDFITSGDVVRIKIPNGTGKNQYLWLENHQGVSIYDNRKWITAGDGTLFPSSPRGLVAYIEAINDNKNQTSIVASGAGGIKYISAKGKFDYTYDPNYTTPSHFWYNKVYNFSVSQSNPISGQFPCNGIMEDYNSDGTIYKTFDWNATPNDNESACVVKQDNVFVDDFIQHNINFNIGDKFGVSSNPTLINFPVYSTSTYQGTYYLNGISVEIKEQFADGSIKIKVNFNDVKLTNSVKWNGKIELDNITQNSDFDLKVLNGITLSIDKTATPNRSTKTASNDFFDATIFSVVNDAFFLQDFNSTVIVDNQSTLKLKDNSLYEINTGAT